MAAIPTEQVGAFPSLALSPGGTVTCCGGGNLVAFPLPSQQLDTCSFPGKQLGSSSEQGCNFGPFQLAFCSPALTGY